MRGPGSPGHFLKRNAHGGGILCAEAAPFRSDAGFDGAERLAVSVAGNHSGGVQVAPDLWQLLLAHAEKVDALAACYFDGRDIVLVHDVGDGAKFRGACDTAPHAG